MKLHTLGTSHAAAEKGRSCSGSLLEINGRYYLFDCGANIESKLVDMGLDPTDVRAIFISHMHEDHIGSISCMLKRIAGHYNKQGLTTDVFFPEKEAIPPFIAWLEAMHFDLSNISRFNMAPVSPELTYNDGTIKVTAIPTKHVFMGKYPSFAYMVETSDKRFLYTGDLAPSFIDYPTVVYEKDFDAILSELVHFDVEKNLPSIIKSRTKKLIFTHIGPSKIPQIEQASDKFPFPVFIANDGDCFDI